MTLSICDWWFCLLTNGGSLDSEVSLGIMDACHLPCMNNRYIFSGKQLWDCYMSLLNTEYPTHGGLVTLWYSSFGVGQLELNNYQGTKSPTYHAIKKEWSLPGPKKYLGFIWEVVTTPWGNFTPHFTTWRKTIGLWGPLVHRGFLDRVHWACWGFSTSLPTIQS